MRLIKIIASLVVLGGLVIAFALLNTDSGSRVVDPPENIPRGTSVGQRALDFQGQTVNGETVRLSDLKGKIIVLNEFASWCAPCLLETPNLVSAAHSNPGDVVFIGLNVLENPGAVSNYKNEFQVPYPLVLDPQGKITNIYKPVGIPTSWFIDAHGIIRYMHSGPVTEEMVQQILDDIRSGKPINGI